MMSQEHQGTNAVTPEVFSGKRKRGRPREDDSLDISGTQGSDVAKRNRRRRIDSADCTDTALVGQVVSGVLDGSFDAGYLLTVRVGETGTVLRGVVFEPGLSVPISAANDVAPHVKMIKRNEVTIPVSSINPVPSLAVGQNPSKLLHVNESGHPSEGSPSTWGPKVQKYDGSGPSSGPLNSRNDVGQVALPEMQSECKTDPKVEISVCSQASQSQSEKGKFVESLPVDETSWPTKGTNCDINEPFVVTVQTLPLDAKVNASSESGFVTSHSHEVPVDSCHVLPSANQETSTNCVDTVEVSQKNDSSAHIGPSLAEPIAMDEELELASVPFPVKVHDVGADVGTIDAVKQVTQEMLVDESTNDVSKVPADVSSGGSIEASDETPYLTRAPSSDDATVREEGLVEKIEIPVQEVETMETDHTVTALVEASQFNVAAHVDTLHLNNTPAAETLQSNVASGVQELQFNVAAPVETLHFNDTPAAVLQSNVTSGVQELQSNVTLTLETLEATQDTVNIPRDETSHLTEKPLFTEAPEEAKEFESQEKISELVLVGGLQMVTPSAAADITNELQQKEPVLLDLMGPAFSSETPNHEDPEADGGFMELPSVADQNIDTRVDDIPDDPSETGALPQNG
ncbi:hypothetical protein H6P81_006943 [Aristolochia fimbriata]|uniref:Uncharacterized protein n=1 Tax=Aristolochia fimbriata TaxID=158543 RepID=A0AAV7EZW3_ARIFI|nr:hypothetical protein H6P81_006943 [Aristolochia fimbriata]